MTPCFFDSQPLVFTHTACFLSRPGAPNQLVLELLAVLAASNETVPVELRQEAVVVLRPLFLLDAILGWDTPTCRNLGAFFLIKEFQIQSKSWLKNPNDYVFSINLWAGNLLSGSSDSLGRQCATEHGSKSCWKSLEHSTKEVGIWRHLVVVEGVVPPWMGARDQSWEHERNLSFDGKKAVLKWCGWDPFQYDNNTRVRRCWLLNCQALKEQLLVSLTKDRVWGKWICRAYCCFLTQPEKTW